MQASVGVRKRNQAGSRPLFLQPLAANISIIFDGELPEIARLDARQGGRSRQVERKVGEATVHSALPSVPMRTA